MEIDGIRQVAVKWVVVGVAGLARTRNGSQADRSDAASFVTCVATGLKVDAAR
jgi:hypothetical protein